MEVWESSQQLAEEVYTDFSTTKDRSFIDQIRRAVISISNNIAEGSERAGKADFARFLDIAKGSAAEVRSMYHLSKRLKYLDEQTIQVRIEACHSISKQLNAFAKYLRK